MNDRLKPGKLTFLIYLIPGTLLYSFTVILPILYAAYYSLFKWKNGPLKTFIGFDNYITLQMVCFGNRCSVHDHCPYLYIWTDLYCVYTCNATEY